MDDTNDNKTYLYLHFGAYLGSTSSFSKGGGCFLKIDVSRGTSTSSQLVASCRRNSTYNALFGSIAMMCLNNLKWMDMDGLIK